MTCLAPSDVDQFGKLLGLLASDHDGERAVAARKASDFLRKRQLHWQDVAQQLKQVPMVVPRAAPPSRSHQQDGRLCLSSTIAWKPHERDFLVQMATQMRRTTERQQEWLFGLLDRLNREARA